MAKKKTDSIKNTIALKRSIYAVILSVIFIVAVVLLTWLSTVLAERYPLELDLTTNKQHSISNENFDYISKVDKEINIYVLMTEDAYACRTGSKYDMAYIAAGSEFVAYTKENADYYIQTVELLQKYEDYNDKINVTYLDLYNDKNANTIANNFYDYSIVEGDICVEGIFTVDGKKVTRRTVVRFTDIYTLTDPNGFVEVLQSDYGYMYQMQGYTPYTGYGYTISENKIETAISSAIYKVTSASTPIFLVPETYTNSEKVKAALQEILEINNYEIEYKEGSLAEILTEENCKKYAGVILADCKSDITTADSDALDKFLENGGKKEKSLFYFAGTNSHDLVGLCDFLKNWGIGFDPGILYETDEDFHLSKAPNTIKLEIMENDYTPTALKLGGYYYAKNLTYMKQLWQTNNDFIHLRETEAIFNTGSFGQTAVMPSDADINEWTPTEETQMDKFCVALLAQDTATVDNKFLTSYVAAFASADIISADWKQNSVGNFNAVLDLFNTATGQDENAFNFVPKAIEVTSYRSLVTENKVTALKWIFMGAVPVVVVGLGLFVWIRRKRK